MTPQEAANANLYQREVLDRKEELRMRRATVSTAVALLILGSAISTPAQEPSLAHRGRVVIPESAIERPEDVGIRAHPLPDFCARRAGEVWSST